MADDRGAAVPILLVCSPGTSRVLRDPGIAVVTETTVPEAIELRGKMQSPVEIAVVDMHSGTRNDVVVAGLFLRNAGRTVVVGDLSALPTELVRQLHEFSVTEKSAGRSIRTELLLTEEAMKLFGDIGDVVGYFEREFLLD
jgi:hypothetical protein